MIRLFLAACLVVAVMPQSVSAQTVLNRDSWRPSFENDPQGGVLCVWSIYIVTQRIGAVCFQEEAAFQATLDDAVRRMDDFILSNMPTSREALEAARHEARQMSVTDEALAQRCRSGDRTIPDLYRHFRARGPDLVRTDMDRLLATPRRPSMNPCL